MSAPIGLDHLVLALSEPEQELLDASRTWLGTHAPDFAWDSLGYFDVTDEGSARSQVELARAWEAHKFAAGWAGLDLPPSWGGRGLSTVDAALFGRAEARHPLPLEVFAITRGMVIPTLRAHARPAIARDWVGAALRGEQLWCQLFSEPAGGSDLAAIRTGAKRHDGRWTLTGQKTWISRAQFADRGILLARTSTGERRHHGLTMFAVPMDDAGVTVRPIDQITGSRNFCEVFFDDLVVPDEFRLGEVGAGFAVALRTLGFERAALAGRGVPWAALAAIGGADPQRLAELEELRLAIDVLGARQVRAAAPGAAPSPAGSVVKLLTSHAAELSAQLVVTALDGDAMRRSQLIDYAIGTAGARTGGGTEDIQRNTIAERLLGLPRLRTQ